VVNAINDLALPRYGLGEYQVAGAEAVATAVEREVLRGLSRAGKRLRGFCRTNLFKRLESGGPAFVQSVERHILRNYVYLHALEHGFKLPIGTQDAGALDTRTTDSDVEAMLPFALEDDEQEVDASEAEQLAARPRSEADFRREAAAIYAAYTTRRYRQKFKWLSPALFLPSLQWDLQEDCRKLLGVLDRCGSWDPAADAKLTALAELLMRTQRSQKVLIFSQFADTVAYLTEHLQARGITALAGVTGASSDPTALAWRFSPQSNDKRQLPRFSPKRPGIDLRGGAAGSQTLDHGLWDARA